MDFEPDLGGYPTVWMLTNSWLLWDKFEQQYSALHTAATRHSINLVRIPNDNLARAIDVATKDGCWPALVLNMDKDIAALSVLESYGLDTVNSAAAVCKCDDKALTYAALHAVGVVQPCTFATPKVFRPLDREEWAKSAFVQSVTEHLDFPMVVKDAVGSWGTGVHLAADHSALLERLVAAQGNTCVVQEFISASRGEDVRLYFVGDTMVAAMRRTAPGNDFRANVTGGGAAESYEPTQELIDLARTAKETLGLDFGSVDFLFGADGKPFVCEVNSNAQFATLSTVAGVDVADAMMAWIKDRVVNTKQD